MSECLQKAYPILQFVTKVSDPKLQKQLLKYLSDDDRFCVALREIAKNVVRNRLKLKDAQKKILKKHSNCLYNLSEKGISRRAKKKYISQSGGWLLPLLPLVGAVLSAWNSQRR